MTTLRILDREVGPGAPCLIIAETLITRRPVVNIDEPPELAPAEHLLEQQESRSVSS